MKIETKQITTLLITDVAALDPVTVFLENYAPGRGKITIECYGESWTAFWGGMSGNTVEVFFCRCDENYLANKLSSIAGDIFDEVAAREMIKKAILELRKSDEVYGWEARATIDNLDGYESVDDYIRSTDDVIKKVIGDEPWHMDWPTKPNPDYVYLCRIINTVKEALKTDAATKAGAAA